MIRQEDFAALDTIPLTNEAVAAAAGELSVDPAALWAVCDVESNGRGFRSDGLVVMRFEHHIFRQRSGMGFDGGGPNDYGTLLRACELNEAAGLESASYGLFQIMGFNHQACGCDSAREMVERMRASEAEQLRLLCSFIAHHQPILHALQVHDWAGFASRYNGPGFAQNAYDTKLATAYAKRSGGKSQPRLLVKGMDGDDVLALQKALQKAPGLPFPVDETGVFDTGLEEAVIAFQQARGLEADGKVGPRTRAALGLA